MFNDLKLCQSINRGFDEGVQSLASEIIISLLITLPLFMMQRFTSKFNFI